MSAELTSEALLGLLALTLIHGTALAVLTWAADVTVLRRCRPSLKAALWAVVLVKFLLPPVLPGSFGLSALVGSLAPGVEQSVTGSQQGLASGRADEAKPSFASSIYERAISPGVSRPLPQPGRRSHFPTLLLFSYTALLLFLTSKAIVHSRRAGWHVRRLPEADDVLSEEVRTLARRLGLRRAPSVKLDAESATPYVIGAWSPTLVLPAALPARLDPRAREALIIHELAHIGRGDLLVRWLQNAARLVFFFWPPVWWLCRRVERFSEMACDQWAVRFSSASPRLYAESLLGVAKDVRAGALVRHELGFAARRSGLLRARFELILAGAHDASPRLPRRVSAALIGWALFALTGSVIAGAENRARGAVGAATSLVTIMPTPGESADVGDARASVARADAAQGEARERRLVERRARGARGAGPAAGRASKGGAPARDVEAVVSTEISALQAAAAPGQNPVTTSNPDDLDGDGRVSDFEAGFGAGRRYRERRRSRPGCASCEPCAADCGASGRRREIELRARRQRFPDSH